MATAQSSTPSFFNFLKEGLLLPTHNRRLFAAVFAIIVASSSLLLLGNDLAVQPISDEIRIDAMALNGTDPSSPEFLHLIQEIQEDTRKLLITGAVYLLVAVVIGSLIRILLQFAAVATYSGELHTFASLLGKAKAQLKGPLLTLAFVYALEIAYTAFLTVMAGILLTFVVVIKQYLALVFVGALLAIVAVVFLVYFFFVCSLSIIVAVAEPGCHGAGAVGRAWRLMKGKLLRAVVFILVTVVLAAAIWPVYNLAKTCALSNMASGLLLGFLYTILMAAVQVFEVCAMTAFYYECKESTEASATKYIKVSTKEPINV
ncbi:hypothetical protein SEVIR_2G111900v4 [Setaria viridis]|uniref:Uncharacterized protein n=1 Tax=Setaria viridis TaxID=4556 RepID=A0A4U6VP32_SETVI|nr:uncharacterized protein LOC117842867 [Setaria viridis]TKW31531.1 hypothetical protein SEVIR_2G111900v2 [Setaria viridis]